MISLPPSLKWPYALHTAGGWKNNVARQEDSIIFDQKVVKKLVVSLSEVSHQTIYLQSEQSCDTNCVLQIDQVLVLVLLKKFVGQ